MLYQKAFDWKWVCAQHPMILIAMDKSDPCVLETIEPWGAGSLHGYCLKMKQVLDMVALTPELKTDFDLSAKELLIFLQEIPDGKQLLMELVKQGKLGFVGCDYSQAHYHENRSESALRQIRYGLKVFDETIGYTPDTFMHQETGLFENLPQILKAFGMTKSCVHRFAANFEFLETPGLELCTNFGKLELVRDETIALWQGLDGTTIPIYLPIIKSEIPTGHEVISVMRKVSDPEFVQLFSPAPEVKKLYPTHPEEGRGLYRNGSIIVESPDLVKVDDDYISCRKRVGTFWLMSEAIEEEMRSSSRMPKTRYYTYWSYCEGQFGEKLFKASRNAEMHALAAETMSAMANNLLGGGEEFDALAVWDPILAAQHHDVNWFATRDLKDQAMAWFGKAVEMSLDSLALSMNRITSHIKFIRAEGKPIVVFNTLPVKRSALASIPVESGRSYEVSYENRICPCQAEDGKLYFNAELGGLGYRCYTVRESGLSDEVKETAERYDFENEAMKVRVLADGTIASLYSKASGERLSAPGNLIKGLLVREDGSTGWISNQGVSRICEITKGALFDKVISQGYIEDILYKMEIRLYHGLSQTVEVNLELKFNNHEIGDFWHDETKMCVYWELEQKKPEIVIDEPFGVVMWKANRPIHAANFIALLENGKGVVLTNNGTPKSWVAGNRVANVIAWGGRRFTNRSGFLHESTPRIDVRLNGICRYSYTISITEQRDVPRIASAVNSHITPFWAYEQKESTGLLPNKKYLLEIQNNNLIATAVEEREGCLVVRAYDISGLPSIPSINTGMKFLGKTNVAGKPVGGDGVKPYEIIELKFK